MRPTERSQGGLLRLLRMRSVILVIFVIGMDGAKCAIAKQKIFTQSSVSQLKADLLQGFIRQINPNVPRFSPAITQRGNNIYNPIKPVRNHRLDHQLDEIITEEPNEQSPLRSRRFLEQQLSRNNLLIPKLVRLGFHTCFGDQGCNGCLDVTDPHNKGLVSTFSTLREWYSTNSFSLSFADFVALAATEAVEAGISNANCNGTRCSRNLPFKIGRVTCSDIDNPPNVKLIEGDDVHGLKKLMDSFGLTREEAVALIGFHTLGRCREADSGFEGPWDDSEMAADRGYFDHMSRDGFAVNRARRPVQWNDATGRLMFLTPDLTCKYDIRLKADGQPTCMSGIRKCPLASTSDQVDRYAQSTAAWLDDAVPVFLKMIEKSTQLLFG